MKKQEMRFALFATVGLDLSNPTVLGDVGIALKIAKEALEAIGGVSVENSVEVRAAREIAADGQPVAPPVRRRRSRAASESTSPAPTPTTAPAAVPNGTAFAQPAVNIPPELAGSAWGKQMDAKNAGAVAG